MRDYRLKELLLKPTRRASSERMPAEVATTLMSMLTVEQVLTSAEKSPLSSSLSKESQEDPD